MPLKFLNLLLFFLLLHHHHHHQTSADVGTAAYYGPPYLPTVCYGDDPSQFPADNIFAAAGDGIWDNGACCGRQYLVRCLSSSPESCIADQTIRVEVINQASMLDSNPSLNGTTMTLSDAAFLQIANKSSPVINIEFTQI
ncbi:EG45-like domain containing protein isoform X2 [Dioscorea cayenensis subsp. rotundata]|uniref:EG45-like domain containing protein isoform X2 n=1 Tax=Dioscorea cayennensis subsp. rotundata TaxID=55577 RepID=A0AB40BFE3_DIOCR|nr:EG45-like domain containing protein isoform X2 [Dioscorea cayenensis subsp. rotundata]